jgi:hypothetical protein
MKKLTAAPSWLANVDPVEVRLCMDAYCDREPEASVVTVVVNGEECATTMVACEA